MKVLWLTNVPLSKVRNKISSNTVQTGGWLDGMSDGLLLREDIEFMSIFPYSTSEVMKGQIDNISYIAFPTKHNEKLKINLFNQVLKDFQPDIIHIFGTEFKQTLLMMQVCKQLGLLDKTIINIQGLLYIYSKHYFADLPFKVVNGRTFRDIIKRDSIKQQRKKFIKRGKDEIEALKLSKNIIGRTDWDKATTTQINPYINYYHCNETLRNVFYFDKWDYENCQKHSIFVSQCSYPIKGFHKILQAMPLILQRYPDAKIYTTGKDLVNITFKDKFRQGSYQKYLRKLIIKNNLTNCVKFLGMLSGEDMKKAYLNANCFVSCSAIENSPNSVGEAMLLGVPTVSSDVGGVKNLLKHNGEGYIYPFDEEYMLAYYVCKIFEQQDCKQMTSQSIKRAEQIYDKQNNLQELINIYQTIKTEEINE